MSFAETIKKEIISKPPKDRHCKKSFLAGVIRGSGKIYEKDDEIGIEFNVFGEDTAMLVISYINFLFSYEVREITASEDRLLKKDKFTISILGEKAEYILNSLGILKEDENGLNVDFSMFDVCENRECCVKSLIRGLFVSSGSCTMPSVLNKKNTGYHLEIVFSHNVPAYKTSEILSKYGIVSKIINRKEDYVLYIKSIEEIKNFLAFISTPVALLKLMDTNINRELSNISNRQKNCDMGNVSRQVEAASKQIQAIEKIEKYIGLKELKEDLFIVAKTRKENPEDNVVELGEKLGLTKSCINHRLRKIIEIAKEI